MRGKDVPKQDQDNLDAFLRDNGPSKPTEASTANEDDA